MKSVTISESVKYIGADDATLDLFEGQYVVPNGISYNSYVILDEKIAVMDTIDMRKLAEWKDNLKKALAGRTPDYLIISHMEPDHAAGIQAFAEMYPKAKLVASAKAVSMLPQFFENTDLAQRAVAVKEGETLSLGSHTLTFLMAPMVHWPEVMVEYEQSEKILFSADGFGKFGTLDTEEDWTCEARRYYFNIVGKFGAPVQTLLKKAASLDIQTICPLHGPVLADNLEYYIGKYMLWSSYEPEDDGVLIAYASFHGNTKRAAENMKEILEAKGVERVALTDLSRDDMAEAVEDAFRYDKLILAASSYDGSVSPCMQTFLNKLIHKNYQKRRVGLIENGSWAPCAARVMKGMLEGMKEITLCEKIVSVRSAVKKSNIQDMKELAEEILR